MTRVRHIKAVWAHQIVNLLEACDRPASELLKEVDLDRKSLSGPDARIPFVKHVELLNLAADQLGDPAFGLHLGSNVDPMDAGAVAYVAANSPNLGAAIGNFLTYLHTINEALRGDLDHQAQLTVLTLQFIDPKAHDQRHAQELCLGAALKIARFLVGHRISPAWIDFSHARGENLDDLRRWFNCRIQFDQAQNAIAFHAADLALPCKNADPRLLHILTQHCDTQMAKLKSQSSLIEQVKHLIAQNLTSGCLTLKSVARDLGMSERSFARRLAEQGTTFGTLLNELRCQLAKRYLADPSIRTNQAAYMLGYSEPAAFTSAFSRWTGQTPTDYRRSAVPGS